VPQKKDHAKAVRVLGENTTYVQVCDSRQILPSWVEVGVILCTPTNSNFTKMIMRNFDVIYKVAKQSEVILKGKRLRQIKAWYKSKTEKSSMRVIGRGLWKPCHCCHSCHGSWTGQRYQMLDKA